MQTLVSESWQELGQDYFQLCEMACLPREARSGREHGSPALLLTLWAWAGYPPCTSVSSFVKWRYQQHSSHKVVMGSGYSHARKMLQIVPTAWSMLYVCYCYISMIPFCLYVAVYFLCLSHVWDQLPIWITGYLRTGFLCFLNGVCVRRRPHSIGRPSKGFFFSPSHLRSAPACIFTAIIASII